MAGENNALLIDENNDIYYGNLALLKRRQNAWSSAHPASGRIKVAGAFIAAAAIAVMCLPLKLWPGNNNALLAFIALALLILYFAGKSFNRLTKAPFEKIHSARFETSDEGIWYSYQYGMKIYNYFIADEDIETFVVDEKYWIVYFEGPGQAEVIDKKGKRDLGTVDKMYCLIPFDEFDLDDLTAPYGDAVTRADGTMRDRFCAEKEPVPQILMMKE